MGRGSSFVCHGQADRPGWGWTFMLAATVACVVDGLSGESSAERLRGGRARWGVLRPPAPRVSVVYEAGPRGLGLARVPEAAVIYCVVAAPGKIERPAQYGVKTDKRDPKRLLRSLMSGGPHPVRVPSNEEDALPDLVRAREEIRGDPMRSRHRTSKLLPRHDVRHEDTASAWTAAHRAWNSPPTLVAVVRSSS